MRISWDFLLFYTIVTTTRFTNQPILTMIVSECQHIAGVELRCHLWVTLAVFRRSVTYEHRSPAVQSLYDQPRENVSAECIHDMRPSGPLPRASGVNSNLGKAVNARDVRHFSESQPCTLGSHRLHRRLLHDARLQQKVVKTVVYHCEMCGLIA